MNLEKTTTKNEMDRRHFLKLIGATAFTLPTVALLSSCDGSGSVVETDTPANSYKELLFKAINNARRRMGWPELVENDALDAAAEAYLNSGEPISPVYDGNLKFWCQIQYGSSGEPYNWFTPQRKEDEAYRGNQASLERFNSGEASYSYEIFTHVGIAARGLEKGVAYWVVLAYLV